MAYCKLHNHIKLINANFQEGNKCLLVFTCLNDEFPCKES